MEETEIYDVNTSEELLAKLRSYTVVPDDDNIRYKQKIKETLLNCPELLYALDGGATANLFDEDGNIVEDGWDEYFGMRSLIRPCLSFPETQTEKKAYVTYDTSFTEEPRYNTVDKYALITFRICVYNEFNIEPTTGIARHDLIGSIIRERFNWSNIFGRQCKLVSDKPGASDTNYVTRTLTFQVVSTNGIYQTDKNGVTSTINYRLRK